MSVKLSTEAAAVAAAVASLACSLAEIPRAQTSATRPEPAPGLGGTFDQLAAQVAALHTGLESREGSHRLGRRRRSGGRPAGPAALSLGGRASDRSATQRSIGSLGSSLRPLDPGTSPRSGRGGCRHFLHRPTAPSRDLHGPHSRGRGLNGLRALTPTWALAALRREVPLQREGTLRLEAAPALAADSAGLPCWPQRGDG